MCFLSLWNKLFFDNEGTELLSHKIEVAYLFVCPKSIKSILKHMEWHVVVVVSTYFSSVEQMETMGYFLDSHEIKLLPIRKAYVDVILLSSMMHEK